ncbi:hypothetical protein [Micromonospora sp. L32]|uniref:hypothetical protein n=1 Tax=Micromonospora sp. L32 TaxID=3452214 RepID=UPI003F88F019
MHEKAIGFGYKLQWLAVRGQHADAVAGALNLNALTAATWLDAVAAAYDGHWLLTPSLDGWTLAASREVPAPEDERFVDWLAGLSRLLGEVQYFGTHRVVGYQCWGRARSGVVERAFAYLGERGEVLFDVGEATAEEREVRAETADDEDEPWSDEDGSWPRPDEETVMALAARWSVDPSSLHGIPVPGHPWIASA